MSLQIFPLAITMMAGPQILSAIIFVTTDRPVRSSVAFLLGVAVAECVGVAIALGLATWLDGTVSLGDSSDLESLGKIIQYALVGLLLIAAVRKYLGRATAEPPRWLGTLMTAGPARALRIGLLVILCMPSDIAVMLTVGTNLAQNEYGLAAALPFLGATLLVAALPLLAYLGFGQRARTAMPRLRDWMNSQSWLVNVVVYLFFVGLILSD